MDESKFRYSIIDTRRLIAEEILKEGLDDNDLVGKLKEMYDTKLGWCRCGNPIDALIAVYHYLISIQYTFESKKESLKVFFGVENIDDNPLLQCLAYECDRAHLTKHNFNIGDAWPDWDGIRLIMYLEELMLRGHALKEIRL